MSIDPGNEIEILPARRPLQTQALGQLFEQAKAMAAAEQLGSALAGTDMVPADYRGKPGNAAAAILYGAELGLNAIQSLQQIFVIHGKPAIYARTAVALVMRAGIRVETVSTTNQAVTVRATDLHSGQVEESTWDIARATTAGFTTNKKYQTEPEQMLYAKAAMEVCRKIAPDVLLGIPMSREELDLEQAPAPRKVASTRRGVEGLRAQITPVTEIAVETTDGVTDVVVETTVDFGEQPDHVNQLGVTGPQLKRLASLIKAAGFEDDADGRNDWLAWLTDTTGRQINATKELTKAEAAKVIDTLETDAK